MFGGFKIFVYFCTQRIEDRAPAFMNLGLRRSFIKRRSNMRGSPMLIISEYVEIARCTCQLETGTGLQPTRPIDCVRGCFARCHSKSESIRIA